MTQFAKSGNWNVVVHSSVLPLYYVACAVDSVSHYTMWPSTCSIYSLPLYHVARVQFQVSDSETHFSHASYSR